MIAEQLHQVGLNHVPCLIHHVISLLSVELPELVSLDLSYCDKVSHAGLGAIASFGRLETLAISNCPRVTDTAVSALTESCPNLKVTKCCNPNLH